jgi:hypothetical protein
MLLLALLSFGRMSYLAERAIWKAKKEFNSGIGPRFLLQHCDFNHSATVTQISSENTHNLATNFGFLS